MLAVARCWPWRAAAATTRTDATPAATTTAATEPATDDRRRDDSPRRREPRPRAGRDRDRHVAGGRRPGGAGDEEPAESQALFTGRGGRITPRVVRVPAFIAIRVELRSADGGAYCSGSGAGRSPFGSELPTVSHRFDGLRPGEALVGKSATGAGNGVRIEATAEPGP